MATPPSERIRPQGQRSFARLVGLVARREYLRTIRRRGFLFGTLLLPLVIGGVVAVALLASSAFDGEEGGRPTIVLVNESRLRLAPADTTELELRIVDRPEAVAGLADGRWQESYVVPDGYPERGEVERVVAPTRSTDIGALERRVTQQAALAVHLRRAVAAAEGIPDETVERLVQPVTIRDIDAAGRPAPSGFSAAAVVLPTLFTMLFVLSIFITSNYLLQSVTEEKENRVVEIVLSSLPALHLMAGKVLGLGAAGLTQVVVWLVTALVALPLIGQLAAGGTIGRSPGGGPLGSGGLPGPGGIPGGADAVDPGAFAGPGLLILVVAVAYFVLGYLAYGALFAAIGALAPGTREAQQYSGVFGFVAVIPFILSSVFLADPGSPIVTALVMFPMTSPAAALQLLMLAPEPPWLVVGISLALLVAFVAVATLASARVFRATLLLYGTRPSVGGVVGALLGRA